MSDFSREDIIDAHKYSNNHRKELQDDKVCGCFYCIKIFKPSKIVSVIEVDNDCDREGTAICPYCGIDSVIGESSGYPITAEFLAAMNEYWFK